jgi:hypothetical protein
MASSDELTDSERVEYEGYIQASKFIAVLRANAPNLLDQAKPG